MTACSMTLITVQQVEQYKPDIVDTIFVKTETIHAIRSINQQLYVFTHTEQQTQANLSKTT